MKIINYELLASYLRRLMARHTNRVTVKLFQVELKSVINAQEAKRLFKYYRDIEKCLVALDGRYYGWRGIHQEHFSADAIRDIFLKWDIQSVFGNKGRIRREENIAAVAIVEDKKIEIKKEKIDNGLKSYTTKQLIMELFDRGLIKGFDIKL